MRTRHLQWIPLTCFHIWPYQNDEETSNIDQKRPLALIVEEFRLRKEEEEEERLLESTDEYDNNPKKNVLSSSWSLLKILSLRLQNPDERESAAILNVHTLTLDFILKSLPTTEHNVRSKANYVYLLLIFPLLFYNK